MSETPVPDLKAVPNSIDFDVQLNIQDFNRLLLGFGVVGHKKMAVNDTLTVRYITKQYRFPKSKKARIRKKWRKNPDNFRTERHDTIFDCGDTIFVSQKIYDRFMKESGE